MTQQHPESRCSCDSAACEDAAAAPAEDGTAAVGLLAAEALPRPENENAFPVRRSEVLALRLPALEGCLGANGLTERCTIVGAAGLGANRRSVLR